MRGFGAINFILALTLSISPQPTETQETPGELLPVRQVILDNGMRLLILRRPGSPTISFAVRFNVGSVNEQPGNTGIAHFLEHMLF